MTRRIGEHAATPIVAGAIEGMRSAKSSNLRGCDFLNPTKVPITLRVMLSQKPKVLNCGNHTEFDWFYKITARERATLHRLAKQKLYDLQGQLSSDLRQAHAHRRGPIGTF